MKWLGCYQCQAGQEVAITMYSEPQVRSTPYFTCGTILLITVVYAGSLIIVIYQVRGKYLI